MREEGEGGREREDMGKHDRRRKGLNKDISKGEGRLKVPRQRVTRNGRLSEEYVGRGRGMTR